LRVDRHAADLAKNPIVGQRLRPVRIDPKDRALRRGWQQSGEQQRERGHKCRGK
jgi:hypothetical protein